MTNANNDVLKQRISCNYIQTPFVMQNVITKIRIYLKGLTALRNAGLDVFASRTDFAFWLLKPSFFFKKKAPISYLKSIKGIILVRQGLRAINYTSGRLA